jgi:hypothetical protein
MFDATEVGALVVKERITRGVTPETVMGTGEPAAMTVTTALGAPEPVGANVRLIAHVVLGASDPTQSLD